MLADCIAFLPRLKRIEDLLVMVYGQNRLPRLEAAAAKKLAKRVAAEGTA